MAFLAPIAASLLPGLLGKVFNFKDGGMVPGKTKGKAQVAVVHTGERVLSIKQNKDYEKMMKAKGNRMTKMMNQDGMMVAKTTTRGRSRK
jgi:hypothetical protein